MKQLLKKLVEADIEVFRDYLLSFGAWAPVISFFSDDFYINFVRPLPAFVVTFSNGLIVWCFLGWVVIVVRVPWLVGLFAFSSPKV
ncbi:hypothetical protein KHA80_22800 [Anaerobacillus sp. HL2]|nr:hypothetical protein KHA80_22800 [Anaerobacillus sp. HL2]